MGGMDLYRQVKQGKPYAKGDIIVYALILLLIAYLFWHFIFAAGSQPLSLIHVYYEDRQGNETLIFSYSYEPDEFYIDEKWTDNISVSLHNGAYEVLVSGLGEDAAGFNSFSILHTGEVFMTDADCSARKDCTHFPHIIRGNMAIACVPHRLKIIGEGEALQQESSPFDVDILLGRLP